MKIKDYWRRLKEINDFLLYFPPDKSFGSPQIAPSVLDDNDLKDILNGALPSAFKAICKQNQFNVLAHPINDAMDYLQDVKGTCTISTRTTNSNTSNNSSKKEKNSGKGKGAGKSKGSEKSKVGSCPIVTSIPLQKLRTFLTADHYQVKNESLIPTRVIIVTSNLDTRNQPLG